MPVARLTSNPADLALSFASRVAAEPDDAAALNVLTGATVEVLDLVAGSDNPRVASLAAIERKTRDATLPVVVSYRRPPAVPAAPLAAERAAARPLPYRSHRFPHV